MNGTSMVIPSGTIKRLHVNRSVIARNVKQGANEPVCKAQTSNGGFYGRSIEIRDDKGNTVATLKQSNKPLSCGARVWVETTSEVVISE